MENPSGTKKTDRAADKTGEQNVASANSAGNAALTQPLSPSGVNSAARQRRREAMANRDSAKPQLIGAPAGDRLGSEGIIAAANDGADQQNGQERQPSISPSNMSSGVNSAARQRRREANKLSASPQDNKKVEQNPSL